MLTELNLTTLVNQLETDRYGVDEQLMPTLQTTDELGLPGGFTHACVDVTGPSKCSDHLSNLHPINSSHNHPSLRVARPSEETGSCMPQRATPS